MAVARAPAPDRLAALKAAIDDLEAHRFDRAAARCEHLLARDADDTDAMLVCGLATGASGDAVRAAPLLDRVARARPDAAHPCRDLAGLLAQSARPERIARQFRASLDLAPEDASLRYAFADFLRETGRAAEAVDMLREALRLRPAFPRAHNLMAIALAERGDTAAALAHLRDAVALDPGDAAAWTNLGMLLKTTARFAAAITAYDTALALQPDDPQIRVNRVVALLRAGRWAEAWTDYEWRLSLPGSPAPPARMLPKLSALPTLAGRTILAVHENGFGDTLQFARYLPLLADRGARVLAVVPPPLTRIMRSVAGVAAVLGPDDPVPDHDYVCPFCSLPRVFETTPDTVPAAIPYFHADPALVATWARHLPGGRRVGLVWAGQSRPWLPGFDTLNAHRNLPLAALAPLAVIPDVTFISLQKGPAAAEAHPPPDGMVLIDHMDHVEDFADTAGIIACLDLVISVDTAVAHLAGALGKPVHLLDRYDNCWRWLSERTDSPWYPALRIFRQHRPGHWPPVVQRVAKALSTREMGMLLYQNL